VARVLMVPEVCEHGHECGRPGHDLRFCGSCARLFIMSHDHGGRSAAALATFVEGQFPGDQVRGAEAACRKTVAATAIWRCCG